MKQIRTTEQLNNILNEDRTWRLRELDSIKKVAWNTEGKYFSDSIYRAGIVLAYAHWEGYVKNTANSYVNFVFEQKLPIQDLHPAIVSLFIHAKNLVEPQNKQPTRFIDIVSLIRTPERQIKFSNINFIDTESNLTSIVFKRICQSIGTNFSSMEEDFTFIDANLLRRRNAICHGEQVAIDTEEFDEITDRVLKLLDKFKTSVENGAALGLYKSQ